MTSETIRIERLTLTPTTAHERAAWLGARVTTEGAEIVIKVEPNGLATQRESRTLRFGSAAEIAALEDALRVMRTRLEEAERAALSR